MFLIMHLNEILFYFTLSWNSFLVIGRGGNMHKVDRHWFSNRVKAYLSNKSKLNRCYNENNLHEDVLIEKKNKSVGSYKM